MNTQAIILAAGRGSRMQQLTNDYPKCLLKVNGKALLEWQCEALSSAGIHDIRIVTGYKSNMIEQYGYPTIHNQCWEKTNMVSSLLCASSLFGDRVLVSYSDILYTSDIVSGMCSKSEDVVVVYDQLWETQWRERFGDPLIDAESFQISEDGKITDIGRKTSLLEEIQGQYTGLMIFSKTALDQIQVVLASLTSEDVRRMDMTTLLRTLIHRGMDVHGFPICGGWYEIDSASDFEYVRSRLW